MEISLDGGDVLDVVEAATTRQGECFELLRVGFDGVTTASLDCDVVIDAFETGGIRQGDRFDARGDFVGATTTSLG